MKTVMLTEYGGPEVLQVVEAPVPQPQAGEVLIKMSAAGISKPDWLMRTGAYPWTKGILPFYPGLYGSGIVEAVGQDVEAFAPGDPVFVDHPVVCGCYGQYKTAPVKNVCKMPQGVDMTSAALMTNYVIALSLFRQVLGQGEGKTLYMKGAAGALGSAVMQIAPLMGYKVIASASSEKKCEYLRSFVSGPVFCYSQQDETETVLSLTDGRGADVVMDQVAGPDMPSRLGLLAECGTILVYNYLDGCENTGILKALIDNMGKCQSVRVFSFHLNDDKPEMLAKLRAEVFQLMLEGKVKPSIFAKFTLEDIQKAHQLLDSGDFCGSLVLVNS